jgi:hypothetical protein
VKNGWGKEKKEGETGRKEKENGRRTGKNW